MFDFLEHRTRFYHGDECLETVLAGEYRPQKCKKEDGKILISGYLSIMRDADE